MLAVLAFLAFMTCVGALVSAPFWIPAILKCKPLMQSKGYRRIYCKHTGLAVADAWYTWAKTDPFGDMIAYRHHDSKIGLIKLNEDGTGEYCGKIGNIEWIDAP